MHPDREGVQYVKDVNRGSMMKERAVVIHNCIGTESSKIGTFNFQQTNIFESSSFSYRQHHCT